MSFAEAPVVFVPDEAIYSALQFPNAIGDFKIARKDVRKNIMYCDWSLTFAHPTQASKPNNGGKDEIQIIFNLNRTIEWLIDGGRESVQMNRGEVCVFRNNDYQTSMTYEGGCDFEFKSLQMETDFFRALMGRYFPAEKIAEYERLFLTHVTKTFITPDMFRILSEIDGAHRYNEFSGIFLESKTLELIALVLYGIAYEKTAEIPRVPNVAAPDVRRMEELRTQIQRAPANDWRTATVAQRLSMSESKVCRLFKALYGMPLHAYVQEQRLEYAANLIRAGGANISEAALQSGYTNLSHFSKEFQKRFGLPPKKFAMTENR